MDTPRESIGAIAWVTSTGPIELIASTCAMDAASMDARLRSGM
jgi:hypothetical protein